MRRRWFGCVTGFVVDADNDDRAQGWDRHLDAKRRAGAPRASLSAGASSPSSRTGSAGASIKISQTSDACSGSTTSHSLHRDNTCAGCHSPTNGFGDTQSIAIGVDNNGLVGPNRTGPRNQRRSPMVINTAFYPKLMWNGRFFANALDPTWSGRSVPEQLRIHVPELPRKARWAITITFCRHRRSSRRPSRSRSRALRARPEPIGCPISIFDDGHGLPLARSRTVRDSGTSRSGRQVLEILNATPGYRLAFGKVFPEVDAGAPITFDHFAPRDRRVRVHARLCRRADRPVRARARERDDRRREARRAGVLRRRQVRHVSRREGQVERDVQRLPELRRRHPADRASSSASAASNMIYDGPGANEDFGAMQISGDTVRPVTSSARRR